MSIRFKVILPYLLLTLLVAVTGVYVVTNLVTNTLSERLTNQLLEAGRVIADDLVRQELSHIETARVIAYTGGVSDALTSEPSDRLRGFVMPISAGLEVENIFIYDGQGVSRLHLVQRPDGGLGEFSPQGTAALNEIVTNILTENNPESLPQRVLDIDPVNQNRYYYTAVPIPSIDDQATVGVVVIGTSLDTLLPYFKSTSLANIILYDLNGDAIRTTFSAQSVDPLFLSSLNIPEEMVQEILNATDLVYGENLKIDGRDYRLARGHLRVSNSELGVFAVALPLQFVIETGADSRNTYVLIFTVAMIFVVVVGFMISRLIIKPLSSLVSTSQAITAGDLTKRSGIQSRDEIGTLAHSFDEMTQRLQQYTADLERSNQMLEQMDQAKASFIQVAAHELRTPLTLVKGYAQMLQSEASSNPNLNMLSQGILDGYERMASIVGNMLDVSKIDSQMLKVVPGPVQINFMVMQVEKLFKDALTERNITIEKKNLNALPVLSADPDLMKKAFYHLIINAIKYTPDGGIITISGREIIGNPKPTEIEIVFEDTGIGIAAEHQELIFEKFYQTGEVLLHSSSKTNFKGGGPGLGLAIAYGIIEAHQGKIWVESPGYDEETCPGARFYVRLPLEQKS